MNNYKVYNFRNNKINLKIKAIENGTVIDHINNGQAFNVLKVLGINEHFKSTISFVMNAQSSSGMKDVVKIEGMELTEKQVSIITLITPLATVNIIRNYNVVKKRKVLIPDKIVGLIKCINPNCISNKNEPIYSKFFIFKVDDKIMSLCCEYCESLINQDDIHNHF